MRERAKEREGEIEREGRVMLYEEGEAGRKM